MCAWLERHVKFLDAVLCINVNFCRSWDLADLMGISKCSNKKENVPLLKVCGLVNCLDLEKEWKSALFSLLISWMADGSWFRPQHSLQIPLAPRGGQGCGYLKSQDLGKPVDFTSKYTPEKVGFELQDVGYNEESLDGHYCNGEYNVHLLLRVCLSFYGFRFQL